MRPPPQSDDSKKTTVARAARYIAIATQLPFAIVAGYFAGYGLDIWLGTTWLRIACLILAIIAAFAQIIRQALRDQAK